MFGIGPSHTVSPKVKSTSDDVDKFQCTSVQVVGPASRFRPSNTAAAPRV